MHDVPPSAPGRSAVADLDARVTEIESRFPRAAGMSDQDRLDRARRMEPELLPLAEPLLSQAPGITPTLSFPTLCIWETLAFARSRPFAALLRSHVHSPIGFVAMIASGHLSRMAFAEDLTLLSQLLAESHPSVVAHILAAAGHLEPEGCAQADVARAYFPRVSEILTGRAQRGVTKQHIDMYQCAVDCAFRLDAKATDALIRSRDCLHDRNPAVRTILWSIERRMEEDSSIAAPDPVLLWPIYEALRSGTLVIGEGFEDQVRGLILLIAAWGDPERVRAEAALVIDKIPSEEWSQLRDFSRQALQRCDKVPDPQLALHALQSGEGSFGKKATGVLRAMELAQHVITDGLGLYFCNRAGEWSAAARGLRILGQGEAVAIVERAAAQFGPGGLPSKAEEAGAALDALARDHERELLECEKQFESHTDAIFAAVADFVSTHPSLFNHKPNRQGKSR